MKTSCCLLFNFIFEPIPCCSTACRTPPAGMEAHIPVLFLDLNGKADTYFTSQTPRWLHKCKRPSFCTPPADNLTVNEQLTGPHAAGVNSILPKEHGSQFFYLPIIRHSDEEVSNNGYFTALSWSKILELNHRQKKRLKCFQFGFSWQLRDSMEAQNCQKIKIIIIMMHYYSFAFSLYLLREAHRYPIV